MDHGPDGLRAARRHRAGSPLQRDRGRGEETGGQNDSNQWSSKRQSHGSLLETPDVDETSDPTHGAQYGPRSPRRGGFFLAHRSLLGAGRHQDEDTDEHQPDIDGQTDRDHHHREDPCHLGGRGRGPGSAFVH